ncbi:succinate dehydrogenase subunit C [Pseudomonas segetis]|uniref:Succinate dehydrogenase cytochrome b556 subunit n=1 Tax=Pseudomonas segetis TaxID=298908 RepID=A0A239IXM0_9PSED|nr:succinate dehydrogenase subunit C [Pseudomonas segetis]
MHLPTTLPCNFGALSVIKKAVNSQRPVNLDLRTIKLPITAYTSILHRISGVILFVGIAVLLYALDKSLASEEGFAEVKECLTSPLAKFVIWALLSALLYHLVAGVRHIIMDMGIGESLEGGALGSKIVLAVAAVMILLLGVWIW